MAKHAFDTFLPSGALDEAYYTPVFGTRAASLSPAAVPPRTYPNYIPSQAQEGRSSSPRPHAYAPSFPVLPSQRPNGQYFSQQAIFTQEQNNQQRQQGPPLSPPSSRNSSSEDSRATQIQGWRVYTHHLWENARGERAHMEADRARLEEVMAEERSLWDQERNYLNGRINKLEAQLAALVGHEISSRSIFEPEISPTNGQPPQKGHQQAPRYNNMNTSGIAGSNGNAAKIIPQESGRNPDGSPFYAPVSQNPSRTFETSQNDDLRVDNMSAPRETPLRVTSRELTQSDFGLQSPPAEPQSREGSANDSIDISYLQPELEGVPIKASAVLPAFVAKVLSPNLSLSPSKPSSRVTSPLRRPDAPIGEDGLQRSGSKSKKSTLELIAAPETRRLTMNAGHTPNHSIHKIEFEDSGNATPTQSQLLFDPSLAHGVQAQYVDENVDPDPELRGPLGLKNDPPQDELFLAALTNKLKEIKESGLLSPSGASVGSKDVKSLSTSSVYNALLGVKEALATSKDFDGDDEPRSVIDEAPVLKVKSSMNFGRPFGSL